MDPSLKLEGKEEIEDASGLKDIKEDSVAEMSAATTGENSESRPNPQGNSGSRGDGNPRMRKMDYDVLLMEPVPRVLSKDKDPSLVKRNRRMLGQLLGTLEILETGLGGLVVVDQSTQWILPCRSECSRSLDHRRCSSSQFLACLVLELLIAEEKARGESERLRQQQREQIAEKRRRDLTLRARVAAKAEQKKMELRFILWSEHHKKKSNFMVFLEWKNARRAELSEYQKQIEANYTSNADKELDMWQNARNARRSNNLVNLQGTMDKELETHRLEHCPKPRRIPGSNDEEEDVEDTVAEDELMDEVLGVPERVDGDASKTPEAGNGSPNPVEMQ